MIAGKGHVQINPFQSLWTEGLFVVLMGLVVSMCLFGTVGYAILLRDMVRPLNDWLVGDAFFSQQQQNDEHDPWLHRNLTLFLVLSLVTPFCTLQRLTALKDCRAASMLSLLVPAVGSGIVEETPGRGPTVHIVVCLPLQHTAGAQRAVQSVERER